MISAVVVSHGHRADLADSLPALVPQVDEVVVIANIPGSEPDDATGVRVIRNPRPQGYAANLNNGIAVTSGELVLAANPDAVPSPGAVETLRAFMAGHPRCGIAGPQLARGYGFRDRLSRFNHSIAATRDGVADHEPDPDRNYDR